MYKPEPLTKDPRPSCRLQQVVSAKLADMSADGIDIGGAVLKLIHILQGSAEVTLE